MCSEYFGNWGEFRPLDADKATRKRRLQSTEVCLYSTISLQQREIPLCFLRETSSLLAIMGRFLFAFTIISPLGSAEADAGAP